MYREFTYDSSPPPPFTPPPQVTMTTPFFNLMTGSGGASARTLTLRQCFVLECYTASCACVFYLFFFIYSLIYCGGRTPALLCEMLHLMICERFIVFLFLPLDPCSFLV